MSKDWDFYVTTLRDTPASVFVDLGLGVDAPVAGFDHLCILFLTMQKPLANGFASREEFQILADLEDSIVPAICAGQRAIFVGRITTGGNRDFFFYTKDADAFATASAEAMARHAPSYTYAVDTSSDTDWACYKSVLRPSNAKMQGIMNRQVRTMLEKQGDVGTISRKIDHFVTGLPVDAKTSFLRELAARGFAVISENRQTANDPFAIGFDRVDRPVDIDAVVEDLVALCDAHRCTYDGWGCVAVQGRAEG